MGKRKTSLFNAPSKKSKKGELPKTFDCLFCNKMKPVTVVLNKRAGTGALSCSNCGEHFQTRINHLSLPVDVYADWVDACDAVAEEAVEEKVAVKVEEEEDSGSSQRSRGSDSSEIVQNAARETRMRG